MVVQKIRYSVVCLSVNEQSIFEKEIQSLKSIFVLEGSFGHMSDIWVDVDNTKDQYFFWHTS